MNFIIKSSCVAIGVLLCLSCAAARPRNGTLIVTVSPAEGGTPGGSGTYPGRTKVTIRAVPFTGWVFTKWSDGSTNAERVVTVPNGGTARYVASLVFVPSGNVALSAEPINGGTVSGAGSYPVGKAVDIRATPFQNWSFTRWQDNLTNNPRTITVPSGSILFTATFLTNTPPEPANTNGTVLLDWSPVAAAFKYIASWGVASRVYTNSVLTNTTSVRIIGLATNQPYYFAVQAMGVNGDYSPFSCEVWGRVGDTNSCSP
jgi:hypothetical protein